MSDEISAPEAPRQGEWGKVVEKWEAKDKFLLMALSGEPLDDEKELPSEQQKEIILRRQVTTCVDVISLVVAPNVGRGEYYPSPKLIRETIGTLRKEETREKIRKMGKNQTEGLSDELLTAATDVLENQAKPVAQKRRFYGEMRKSQEEGNLELAMTMGLAALTAGTPEGSEFARQVVAKSVSTLTRE